MPNLHILITAGATREPIDAVRFLSNISTGATGALLTDCLREAGHTVELLHGHGAVLPRSGTLGCQEFSSTADLGERLKAYLGTGRYDAVIHSAAVSDYRPEQVFAGKLSSDAPEMTVRLTPTPKLLPQLKGWAGGVPLVVTGFKLTSGAEQAERRAAVGKLFATGAVDLVVHNDMTVLSDGAGRLFHVYADGEPHETAVAGTRALADWLERALRARRVERGR